MKAVSTFARRVGRTSEEQPCCDFRNKVLFGARGYNPLFLRCYETRGLIPLRDECAKVLFVIFYANLQSIDSRMYDQCYVGIGIPQLDTPAPPTPTNL